MITIFLNFLDIFAPKGFSIGQHMLGNNQIPMVWLFPQVPKD